MLRSVMCVVAAALVAPVMVLVQAGQSRFRSTVDVVQVWVSVSDGNGRPVTGLLREDFEVAENGVPQPVTYFSDDRVPVSLGLLVDSSDSMRGQGIVDARTAVDRFLGDLLRPVDEVFVSTFSHEPHLMAGWTTPPRLVRQVLAGVQPSGGTALYDALAAFTPFFAKRAHQRAAIVMMSDGADTASDSTLRQTRELLRRTDALVYAIAIDSPDARESSRVNPQALQEITGPSGGYTEVVRSASELGLAAERIADELDHQYSLAYAVPQPADGSWRSIRVRMRNAAYTARARRGYFSRGGQGLSPSATRP